MSGKIIPFCHTFMNFKTEQKIPPTYSLIDFYKNENI